MSAQPIAATRGFDPYAVADTGWFGSSLVKSVSHAVSGAVKTVKKGTRLVSKIPGTSLITAPINVARDVARGKNVARSFYRQGKAVVADTRRSLPLAASVVSFIPGVGTITGSALNSIAALSEGKSIDQIILAAAQGAIPGGPVVAAALTAMKGALSGQSLAEIAEAAVRGAVPAEIMAAVDVTRDVIRGRNVAKSLLLQTAKAFVKGSQGEIGFGQASALLQRGIATVDTLRAARSKLVSEEARRAFDTAVGVAAKAAKDVKAAPKFSAVPSHLTRFVSSKALPRFRPVTPRGAAVLSRRIRSITLGAMHGRRETAGLEQDGQVYRVEKGDNPWAISKKLVGDGNRWRELVKANPKKPTGSDGNFKTLVSGEVLALPSSWVKPLQQTLAADTLSQARAILKVWSTTNGANEAGLTNYGDKPEDSSLTWGSRDRLMLQSFVHWWNTTTGAKLPEVGDLTTEAADALRAWLARHSSTAAPPAVTPQPQPQTQPQQSAPPPTPSPTPAPAAAAEPPMGADVQAGWQAAIASGQPAVLRMYANEMRKKGFIAAADELDRQADALEAQQFGVPNSNTVPVTVTVPKPTTPTTVAKKDDGAGLLLIGGLALAKLAGVF